MSWNRGKAGLRTAALGLGVVLFLPAAGRTWDRVDFLVSGDNAREMSVASSDGHDVIAAWTAGSPQVVRYRPMENRVWVDSPVQLGAGHHPRVFTDLLGTFRLMYASGSTIVTWAGVPSDMEGPAIVSAGTEPIDGFSVGMAPDGTIFLAWEQGSAVWWTTDAPEYEGWSLPYQSTPLDGGAVQVVPRRVAETWQPRIYYTSGGGGNLFWRQFDGAAWGPDVPVPLRVPPDSQCQVVLLADGRHAFVYGGFGFCGNYYYEEDGSGEFLEQPALWSFGSGSCWISDSGPMPIYAAVDGAGRLHVFRNESCFEYHDYDLWGCGFRIFWQWRSPPAGQWAYAPPDEFPGADAYQVTMDCPRFAEGSAVFAWSGYTGFSLRIMTPPSVGAPEAQMDGPRLQVVPNPSAGAVSLRWGDPHRASGAGARAPSALQILDAGGRLVRAFRIDTTLSGQVLWDGLDEQGVPAASGVYFSRILDGGVRRSLPIVLVR